MTDLTLEAYKNLEKGYDAQYSTMVELAEKVLKSKTYVTVRKEEYLKQKKELEDALKDNQDKWTAAIAELQEKMKKDVDGLMARFSDDNCNLISRKKEMDANQSIMDLLQQAFYLALPEEDKEKFTAIMTADDQWADLFVHSSDDAKHVLLNLDNVGRDAFLKMTKKQYEQCLCLSEVDFRVAYVYLERDNKPLFAQMSAEDKRNTLVFSKPKRNKFV